MSTATRTRGRLNRDRLLAAAVALADREGAEALTVRRLAEDLGVHPTSLYHHVPSKEAILDGVVERLLEEADLPGEVPDWTSWVRETADRFRALARAHPGAFMVLARRPAETAAAYRYTEAGLAAFQRGGFSTVQAVDAVRAVSLAVLGLALNECPPMGDWTDPGTDDLTAAGFPLLAAAAEQYEQADPPPEGYWTTLVAALVAGLGRPAG